MSENKPEVTIKRLSEIDPSEKLTLEKELMWARERLKQREDINRHLVMKADEYETLLTHAIEALQHESATRANAFAADLVCRIYESFKRHNAPGGLCK